MKPQTKDVHVYFPVQVLSGIRKLAERNRRSVTAEVVIAVEDYIRERYANDPATNGTRKERGK